MEKERGIKITNVDKSTEKNGVSHSVIIRCPVCKSENIADNSTYESNGILGHGIRGWKTSDIRSCDDCGVVFKPVKGNGL